MAHVSQGRTGNYAPEDRDVFRPLQYCADYFQLMTEGRGEWMTREIVHMSALHLEALVQRIGLSHRLPLGRAIRETMFREKVDSRTWQLLDDFRDIYNAAKHDMGHEKDTHLFSVEDAILAYVVCRKLGIRLHCLADLNTNWEQSGTPSH